MPLACVLCTFDTLPMISDIYMYTDAVDFGCISSSRAACARSCSFSAGRRWRARQRQNGKWPSHRPLTQCCPTDRSSLLPLLVSFFSFIFFNCIYFISVFTRFARFILLGCCGVGFFFGGGGESGGVNH